MLLVRAFTRNRRVPGMAPADEVARRDGGAAGSGGFGMLSCRRDKCEEDQLEDGATCYGSGQIYILRNRFVELRFDVERWL